MVQKYFIAKDGLQTGPYTLQEITQHLQSKHVSWNDYIYDDKKNDWMFLFEFPELTELFNRSFKNPLSAKPTTAPTNYYEERVWYILKHNENYGPFCYLDLIQMLQSKTLFEHDFLWRTGRPSWKRLSEIEEFNSARLKEVFKILATEDKESAGKVFFRRRHPRAQYKCELLIHDKQKVYSAQSMEISAGGASFKIDNVSFELESQIYLHFKPGGDVPPFNAVCKIVNKVADGLYGVSFVHVASSAKDSIAKFTKKAG
ncbi:MAG: GYF domain-containing protein [Pseudobdellovibrio sp.]